jgi:isocitrate dehydrogenase kinase/phosphatase
VAENDVFPEEFRLFFSGNPHAKSAFEAQHADLFDYRYWQKLQAAIRAGYVFDTFPYRRRARFPREDGDSAFTYDMAIRAGDIP